VNLSHTRIRVGNLNAPQGVGGQLGLFTSLVGRVGGFDLLAAYAEVRFSGCMSRPGWSLWGVEVLSGA